MKISGSARLFHRNGLHARPAIKLTKLAKCFRSTVALGLSEDGPWIDAKSIVKVMGLKAPSEITLFFEAEGNDAPAAIAALVALVTSDFTTLEDGPPATVRPA